MDVTDDQYKMFLSGVVNTACWLIGGPGLDHKAECAVASGTVCLLLKTAQTEGVPVADACRDLLNCAWAWENGKGRRYELLESAIPAHRELKNYGLGR